MQNYVISSDLCFLAYLDFHISFDTSSGAAHLPIGGSEAMRLDIYKATEAVASARTSNYFLTLARGVQKTIPAVGFEPGV